MTARSSFAIASLVLTTACSTAKPTPVVEASPEEPVESTARVGESPPVATGAPQTAAMWSPSHAQIFLAGRVDEWIADVPRVGNNFACASTCHTSLPWALAASSDGLQSATGKRLFESVVARIDGANDFRGATPYYGTAQTAEGKRSLASEALVNAWFVNEAAGLGATSKARANAHLWRMQRSDGGFDWMSYGLAPWEDGDELVAAAFAGRAASVAPAGLEKQREKLAAFFRRKVENARPFSLAFAVWALRDWPEAWAPGQRKASLTSIAERAGEDGTWSWKALGIGADDTRDAMPTAMALLALCSASPDARLDVKRPLDWLRAQQLPTGAFPSRSPNRDRPRNHQIATDAATGYALLAIAACEGAVPR